MTTARVIRELRELAEDTDLPSGLGFLMGRMADDLEAKQELTAVTADPVEQTGRAAVDVERWRAPNHGSGHRVLATLLDTAQSWADTGAENEKAMGRLDPKLAKDQPFFLTDIRTLVNEVAKEVGIAPIWIEEK